jgi:hypothetical protein
MADGVDSAAEAFSKAIDPGNADARPRDSSGRFQATRSAPEPMFQERPVEGAEFTGDTSDAGDDPRLRAREREIADGRFDERAHREAQSRSRQASAEAEGESGERRVQREDSAKRRDAASDDGYAGTPNEPERLGPEDAKGEHAEGEDDEAAGEDDAEQDAEAGPRYEVTVDGEKQVVSLKEMQDGYIRTATFHQRVNKANEYRAQVEAEAQRVVAMRDAYVSKLNQVEQEIQALVPQEPDWDAEFKADPQLAYGRQKQYREVYGKLAAIRQHREQALAETQAETARREQNYAIEQFSQFVMDHKIPDEPTLQKVLGGMRKTALNEGFSEAEVAAVYDKRMLNILHKAYLYDQAASVRPQAVATGRPTRTLAPGAARPNGSAARRNVDEAMNRLQKSGKLDDAAAVFQRIL